jgi:hypothetical protein
MLGESILELVLTKGVDVVNVTHLGRGPNIAQKIALLWQQPALQSRGMPSAGAARVRPQRRVRVPTHETHTTRRDRTAVRPRPRSQDLPGLGVGGGQRQTIDGAAGRSTTSEQPAAAMTGYTSAAAVGQRRRSVEWASSQTRAPSM